MIARSIADGVRVYDAPDDAHGTRIDRRRHHHSASSIALARRCERAWAYQYLDGMRDVCDLAWDDPRCTPRQRSLALGTAVHAVGEAYWRGGPLLGVKLPEQIYQSGLHLLPRREECDVVEVELAIADEGSDVLRAFDVPWAGRRDLAVRHAGSWLQIDYKTCSTLRFAHTPETLCADLQACLYTYDLATRVGLDRIASRWLYLETKRVRRAHAVDVMISRDDAAEVIARASTVARHVETIESSATAECNTAACFDFGGCPYHHNAGGPCDARTSIRAFYAHEKERKMAISPSILQKFAALPTGKPASSPALDGATIVPAAAGAPADAVATALNASGEVAGYVKSAQLAEVVAPDVQAVLGAVDVPVTIEYTPDRTGDIAATGTVAGELAITPAPKRRAKGATKGAITPDAPAPAPAVPVTVYEATAASIGECALAAAQDLARAEAAIAAAHDDYAQAIAQLAAVLRDAGAK